MAKSRHGKQASRTLAIKQFKKLINERFIQCSLKDRKALFLNLENWAKTELNETGCEMFLEALYGADITQDIQREIALDNALSKIKGDK